MRRCKSLSGLVAATALLLGSGTANALLSVNAVNVEGSQSNCPNGGAASVNAVNVGGTQSNCSGGDSVAVNAVNVGGTQSNCSNDAVDVNAVNVGSVQSNGCQDTPPTPVSTTTTTTTTTPVSTTTTTTPTAPVSTTTTAPVSTTTTTPASTTTTTPTLTTTERGQSAGPEQTGITGPESRATVAGFTDLWADSARPSAEPGSSSAIDPRTSDVVARTTTTESRHQPVHLPHALAFTGSFVDCLVAVGLALVAAGFYCARRQPRERSG